MPNPKGSGRHALYFLSRPSMPLVSLSQYAKPLGLRRARLVLLEQALNALGEAGHRGLLLRHHLAQVHPHAVHDDAVRLGVLLHLVVQVAGRQQRLRRSPTLTRDDTSCSSRHQVSLASCQHCLHQEVDCNSCRLCKDSRVPRTCQHAEAITSRCCMWACLQTTPEDCL